MTRPGNNKQIRKLLAGKFWDFDWKNKKYIWEIINIFSRPANDTYYVFLADKIKYFSKVYFL